MRLKIELSPPTYMVVGRTGMGKSSTINTLFGQSLAAVADFDACTKLSKVYCHNTPLGPVSVIDTPGLAEDEQATDLRYLELIRQAWCAHAPRLIYISRLDETRFRPDEQRSLSLLTRSLGPSIWHDAITCFTFAASVPSHKRDEQYSTRHREFRLHLHAESPQARLSPDILLLDNRVAHWDRDCQPLHQLLA